MSIFLFLNKKRIFDVFLKFSSRYLFLTLNSMIFPSVNWTTLYMVSFCHSKKLHAAEMSLQLHFWDPYLIVLSRDQRGIKRVNCEYQMLPMIRVGWHISQMLFGQEQCIWYGYDLIWTFIYNLQKWKWRAVCNLIKKRHWLWISSETDMVISSKQCSNIKILKITVKKECFLETWSLWK